MKELLALGSFMGHTACVMQLNHIEIVESNPLLVCL